MCTSTRRLRWHGNQPPTSNAALRAPPRSHPPAGTEVPSWALEVPMQAVRDGPLRARQAKGPVPHVRARVLRARLAARPVRDVRDSSVRARQHGNNRRVTYLAAVLTWALRNVRGRDLDPLRPNIVYVYYHRRACKHINAAHEAGFPLIELPHYGRDGRLRWRGASDPLGLKNLSVWFGEQAPPAPAQRRAAAAKQL